MAEELTPAERREKEAQAKREAVINHPETGDFLRGALVEAAYQHQIWPDQDKDKEDTDWFWTLSYLAGKVLHPGISTEKKLHRIEAAAALLANWHRQVKEQTGASG